MGTNVESYVCDTWHPKLAVLIWYRRLSCWTKWLLFRYRIRPNIDNWFYSDIRLNQYRTIRYLLSKIPGFPIIYSVLTLLFGCPVLDVFSWPSCPGRPVLVILFWRYYSATPVRCRVSDIGKKFDTISDLMSDSEPFSKMWEVPISGSVRYNWLRRSDWVPTFGALCDFLC